MALRGAIADRYIESEIGYQFALRTVSMQAAGGLPNHEASVAKLFSSELNQRVADTGLKIVGLYGVLDRDRPSTGSGQAPPSASNRYAPNRGRMMRTYLNAVSSTLAGGTSEIQRNIIAQRGLGLPRG